MCFAYQVVALPVRDYLAALTTCLRTVRLPSVLVIAVTAVACWWIYVPIHELLHAFGCWVTGGDVTRLEIDALYGAALLQRVFPFVAVGSAYAGQLTGFDTHGNDLTYLATDFVPFLLTVLIGVPLLHAAARDRHRPLRASIMLGAALPIAYAPFVSITGDYYEMGSIIVSRIVTLGDPSFPVARWRSDDLFKLVGELFPAGAPAGVGDAAGVAAALLLGVALAFATYGLGALWARLLGEA